MALPLAFSLAGGALVAFALGGGALVVSLAGGALVFSLAGGALVVSLAGGAFFLAAIKRTADIKNNAKRQADVLNRCGMQSTHVRGPGSRGTGAAELFKGRGPDGPAGPRL